MAGVRKEGLMDLLSAYPPVFAYGVLPSKGVRDTVERELPPRPAHGTAMKRHAVVAYALPILVVLTIAVVGLVW